MAQFQPKLRFSRHRRETSIVRTLLPAALAVFRFPKRQSGTEGINTLNLGVDLRNAKNRIGGNLRLFLLSNSIQVGCLFLALHQSPSSELVCVFSIPPSMQTDSQWLHVSIDVLHGPHRPRSLYENDEDVPSSILPNPPLLFDDRAQPGFHG